jgi:hypothetical protein
MGGEAKLSLSPQVIDGMVFRGREYAAVDDLERALTRWAEEADAAGEPTRRSRSATSAGSSRSR